MKETCVFVKNFGSVYILIILVSFLCLDTVESLCANVGPHGNETLNKSCEWSSWYPWNCTSCNSNNINASQQTFRKRAICCEKDVNLPLCLKQCHYSNDSDTQYANCSNECGSIQGKYTCIWYKDIDIFSKYNGWEKIQKALRLVKNYFFQNFYIYIIIRPLTLLFCFFLIDQTTKTRIRWIKYTYITK